MHALFAPCPWIYQKNTHYPHLPQYRFAKYRYGPDNFWSYISDFT